MSPETAASTLTIPTDVLKFAEEQKVVDYLSPLIDLTHRVYPMAKSFELLLDEDPEIEGDCHILFHVVLSVDVGTSRLLDREWITGLLAICPGPVTVVFRLGVYLRDT